MAALDLLDRGVSAPFREFRSLPPNRFRIRVGTGNRIFFNQSQYISYGYNTWLQLLSDYTTLSARIVDIGCGCGRAAYPMSSNDDFTGHYTGIDIDIDMISWCQKHFPREKFTFIHADVFSSVYNPLGKKGLYKLPIDNDTTDLVFSQSLFTHLLESEIQNYVFESCRILQHGKLMVMGVFCIDDMRDGSLIGDRWTFSNRIKNAFVENLQYPEAAVGYTRDFLLQVGCAAGFSECKVRPGNPQSLLICRK
jgi:SAM-dependent methyltransferase